MLYQRRFSGFLYKKCKNKYRLVVKCETVWYYFHEPKRSGGKAKGPADRRDLLLSHTVNPHNAVRAQNAYLNL